MFMAFGLICGPFGRKSACFKQCPRLESLAGGHGAWEKATLVSRINPSRGIAESRDVPCKHLLRQWGNITNRLETNPMNSYQTSHLGSHPNNDNNTHQASTVVVAHGPQPPIAFSAPKASHPAALPLGFVGFRWFWCGREELQHSCREAALLEISLAIESPNAKSCG
jgi:hypothetical protein